MIVAPEKRLLTKNSGCKDYYGENLVIPEVEKEAYSRMIQWRTKYWFF